MMLGGIRQYQPLGWLRNKNQRGFLPGQKKVSLNFRWKMELFSYLFYESVIKLI